jgi:hypothetical protein
VQMTSNNVVSFRECSLNFVWQWCRQVPCDETGAARRSSNL